MEARWRDQVGVLHSGRHRVAPRYFREAGGLPGPPVFKCDVSRFASTQIAHYANGEIAATQQLDLDPSRGYCTLPALIGREFAYPARVLPVLIPADPQSHHNSLFFAGSVRQLF